MLYADAFFTAGDRRRTAAEARDNASLVPDDFKSLENGWGLAVVFGGSGY